MGTGFCLPIYSTAFYFGNDVKFVFLLNSIERAFDHTNGLVQAKVITQFFIINLDFSFSFRKTYPGIQVIVHPECNEGVVNQADVIGSTERIIRTVSQAPAGTSWVVGTELNLVNRLKQEQTDKQVFFLSPTVCRCATMYRIDAAHLCWALENLAQGHVVNQITVPDDEKEFARTALDRMMALS